VLWLLGYSNNIFNINNLPILSVLLVIKESWLVTIWVSNFCLAWGIVVILIPLARLSISLTSSTVGLRWLYKDALKRSSSSSKGSSLSLLSLLLRSFPLPNNC